MIVRVEHGDCREVMKALLDEGVQCDSAVTDAPYHLTSIVKRFGATSQADATKTSDRARRGADGMARLSRGFMGKQWDGGDIAYQPETWRLVFDLLKPGAHLLAFGSTRGHHRMFCAIEDAGFEIRDTVCWLYGSGFPKSHDVAKGIDKAAGADRHVLGTSPNWRESKRDREKNGSMEVRGANAGLLTEPSTAAAKQWQGWGTALKPAYEPICVARKPLIGTVAANVLTHGTGAINIDGCRVDIDSAERDVIDNRSGAGESTEGWGHIGIRPAGEKFKAHNAGRWPANIVHDGSDEVIAAFPSDCKTGGPGVTKRNTNSPVYSGPASSADRETVGYADDGSAARFFYSAKADATDRLGSKHPTVKPVDLMRWLVRLVTPKGGLVLDPFAGTGTTGMACMAEGMRCILIEREAEYVADIRKRIAHVSGEDAPLFVDTRESGAEGRQSSFLQPSTAEGVQE